MSSFIPMGEGHTGFRAIVQKIGGNLAGMVIPNIGAFIAWGLITALFIPTGWIPNESFAKMVGPMIINLLPILIAYTGGKMVHGHRGGVMGAVAVMGVVVGTDIPMFLGAMIMGPAAAWVIKKIDVYLEPKVPVGFEMLINNFSLGISGTIMAILGFLGVGPAVTKLSEVLGNFVQTLVNDNLLPLAQEMKLGTISMKVATRGRVLSTWAPPPADQQPASARTTRPGTLTIEEALSYNLSLPVSTTIIGVDSVAQLEQNVKLASNFTPLSEAQMKALEKRTLPIVRQALYFRRWELGA